MDRCVCVALVLLSIAHAARAESGLASYYGGRGHRGEMTCAHRTRPLGSLVTVTHASHQYNAASMIVDHSLGAGLSMCRSARRVRSV